MSFFGELAELVAVRYSRYQEVEGDICHISLPCESDSMANMARSHVVKHTQSATLVVSELLAGTATVSRNFLTHSHRPGGSPCTLGAVCERVESRRNFAQAVMEKYSPGKTNQTHKRNHLTPLHIVTARRLRVLFRGARRARRCALFTIPRSRRGHLPHITAMRIGLDGKHGTEPRGEAHAKYVPR